MAIKMICDCFAANEHTGDIWVCQEGLVPGTYLERREQFSQKVNTYNIYDSEIGNSKDRFKIYEPWDAEEYFDDFYKNGQFSDVLEEAATSGKWFAYHPETKHRIYCDDLRQLLPYKERGYEMHLEGSIVERRDFNAEILQLFKDWFEAIENDSKVEGLRPSTMDFINSVRGCF